MTDRCEPPPEWRDVQWHWIRDQRKEFLFPVQWHRILCCWLFNGHKIDPINMAVSGYTYLGPCRPDDATERLRLEAENARLRGLIRAILAADERGQGLPFADAMDAAQEAVYGKRT